jgi:hypothetical protein
MGIEELMSYCAARRESFLKSIAGVEEMYIEDIESTARFQLPALYREFFERMGENQGGLEVFDYSFDAIDLYDTVASSPESYPRERFALLALHRPPPGQVIMNLYFDREAPVAMPGDYAVVAFENLGEVGRGPRHITPRYDSFRELLSFWAFQSFSLVTGRPQAEIYVGDLHSQIRPCLELMQGKLGFRAAMTPTTNCWVGYKPGSDARISHLPVVPRPAWFGEPIFGLDIAGDDARDVARTREILCDHLPVLEVQGS